MLARICMCVCVCYVVAWLWSAYQLGCGDGGAGVDVVEEKKKELGAVMEVVGFGDLGWAYVASA